MGALDLPGGTGPRFPCSSVDSLQAIRSSDVAAIGAVNQALWFRVRYGGRFTKVGLEVTTASGNICVGFYANSGTGRAAVPAGLLATSGSVACPAAGYREIALTTTVTVPDGAWLAISADNNTAAFRALLTSELVNALGAGRCYKAGTSHPLPANAPALTAISGRPIVLVGVE